MKKNNHWLLCHLGALGDFILTWPVLKVLRRIVPEDKFSIIGHPSYCRLAAHLGLIDTSYDRDSRDMIPFFSGQGLPAELESVNYAILWLKEAEHLIKMLQNRGNKIVIAVSPFPPGRTHVTDYYFSEISRYFNMGLTDNHRSPADGNRDIRQRVVIHPGSGGRQKIYSPRFYLDVIEFLSRKGFNDIRVLKGPAEEEKLYQEYFLDLPVEKPPTLVDLKEILIETDLFIGNDSGVSHLSGYLGTPTIALYKITDPFVWGVRGRQVINIQAALETEALEQIRKVLSGLTPGY